MIGMQISSVDMAKRQKLGLKPGMTVRVWQKIQEKGKIRLQAYEGLIIAQKHGHENGATLTVRKVASGVGMEKIFPLYSPNIDKIEIIKTAKVRRAKLYFIRDKAAREIRRRMKQIAGRPVKEEEVDDLVAQVVEGIETGDISTDGTAAVEAATAETPTEAEKE